VEYEVGIYGEPVVILMVEGVLDSEVTEGFHSTHVGVRPDVVVMGFRVCFAGIVCDIGIRWTEVRDDFGAVVHDVEGIDVYAGWDTEVVNGVTVFVKDLRFLTERCGDKY